MMFDENELYIKIVILDKIYILVVGNFVIWSLFNAKYLTQDFIEFVLKEFICSIATSEHLVVGNDLR